MVPVTEWLLLLIFFVAVIASVLNTNKSIRQMLAGVLLLVVVSAVTIGEYRTVLLPLMVATVLTALSLWFVKPGGKPNWVRGTGKLLVLVGSATVAIIPVIFHIPVLPELSGDHQVGHRVFNWVDPSRQEVLTDNPKDMRELAVHFWYPAEVGVRATTEPYLTPAAARGSLLSLFPQMMFMADSLELGQTRHYRDAPLSDAAQQYPVLIFSHGYSWSSELHQALLAAAASRGYVVVSIDHTWEAASTPLANGSRANFVDVSHPEGTDAEQKRLIEAMEKAQATSNNLSDVDREQLWAEAFAIHPFHTEGVFDRWLQDTVFVVDELEGGDLLPVEFMGRINTQQLGIYGMSGGGSTAGSFCQLDARCMAGVNLDGTQFPPFSASSEFSMPFMYILADQSRDTADNRDLVVARQPQRIYRVEIANSTHGSYADFPLWNRLLDRSVSGGQGSGRRLIKVINDYTLAFFDKHMLGKHSALLTLDSGNDYPEAVLQIRN